MNDDEITARIDAMSRDGEVQPINTPSERTDYLSGAFQGALALGTSYLTRRLDIDLQTRIVGAQVEAQRLTNQRQITDHADLTTRAVSSAGGLRLGDLLPFLILGGGAWLLLGKS